MSSENDKNAHLNIISLIHIAPFEGSILLSAVLSRNCAF